VSDGGRRAYRQRARAASTAATRDRIVDSALELHSTVGPARTTISAIAERAGVERLTVYRHFPTDDALLDAVVAEADSRRPIPTPGRDIASPDPVLRLVAALEAMHGYYRGAGPLLANRLRDASIQPGTDARLGPFRSRLDDLVTTVAPGWTTEPARDAVVRVAIRHALAFETWRSLVDDGGLGAEEAIDVLVGLVEAAAEPL
jgi:AcrR family transcriptional regulator